MSAFAIRKNNIGRALVRFLIGAIIIAALVIVINEFWLKKDTPAPERDLTAMETQNYDQAENPVSLAEALNEEENASVTETVANPEATQDAALNETETETADETQEEEGEFGEFEVIETVSEPTPTPTLVPTPTPEPTPTPTPTPFLPRRRRPGATWCLPPPPPSGGSWCGKATTPSAWTTARFWRGTSPSPR